MTSNLTLHIEALIFVSEQPVSIDEIKAALVPVFGVETSAEDIEQALAELKEKFNKEECAFELAETGGGYQFLTKVEYHDFIAEHLKQRLNKRLSKAALETLAIVAYKQPVTKSEVESIRGVNCDYTLQKLLDKELIKITGRSDKPGKPIVYSTSESFMNYFGINSMEDLPKLKDIRSQENNEIGEPGGSL